MYKTARAAACNSAAVSMAPFQLYVDFYSSLFKSLWTLVFARLYTTQSLSKRDLTGRTAIVTGANSGIGLSIATHLTRQGATVYLACRSQERGAKAIDEIVSNIGDKSRDRLHCWKLDTSDVTSVRAFCDRWKQQGSHDIDMLVHNAGIATIPTNSPSTTPEGNDLILTTNFYGSFLMTRLLLLHLTSTARVVLTSSTGHYGALEFLQPPKQHGAPGLFKRLVTTLSTSLNLTSPSAPTYSYSKALQVLFAHLLQRHFDLDPHNMRSAYSFGPGFTSTPIFGKFDLSWRFVLVDPFFALLRWTEKYVAISADQGARTGSWLAAEGDEVSGERGGFWEWSVRQTSLVDFLRGTLGEGEFEKRAREEWRGWEERAGVEWELGKIGN